MTIIRKIAYSLLAISAILGVVFLMGPRIDMSHHPARLNLPQDLDAYLAHNEGQFKDLLPGTEKTIRWADQKGQQTDLALVFMHGFSASRQEIEPLPTELAKSLKANIFYTRFRGHGRGSQAMTEGKVGAWLNDAEEALAIGKRLGKKVVILAVSTGGSSATWLATRNDPALAALVMFSPNYGIVNKMGYFMAWPWGNYLLEWVQGPERAWEPINEAQAKYWTWKYPSKALLPMMGMVKMTETLPFESIKTPVMIIYHPDDTVVDTKTTKKVFERLGSPHKKMWVYETSKDVEHHILVGDIVSPGSTAEVMPEILSFLENAK